MSEELNQLLRKLLEQGNLDEMQRLLTRSAYGYANPNIIKQEDLLKNQLLDAEISLLCENCMRRQLLMERKNIPHTCGSYGSKKKVSL